ncbi:MAG: hypothetical protein HOP28_06305 [Gemmatimonadales bacterium]|nr:hypothetical protein [Gemmatimonadales bacterium]
MSPDERPDLEPKPPQPGEVPVVAKSRQSLARVRRELSDEELGSPAIQRMLIDEIERLERENDDLKGMREQYHQSDKRVASLEQQCKRSLAGEVLFGTCLTVGAAAMGYAPSIWSQQPTGWLTLIFGATITIGGIVSRMVHR